MTTTLLAGLLSTAELNLGRGHTDVQIVETGRVFLPQPDAPAAPIYGVDRRPTDAELDAFAAALPAQPQHVAYVMAGERERSGWAGPGRAAAWGDAVAIAHRVAAAMHLEPDGRARGAGAVAPGSVRRAAARRSRRRPRRRAAPARGARATGFTGRVAAAEIDLDALIDAAPDARPTTAVLDLPGRQGGPRARRRRRRPVGRRARRAGRSEPADRVGAAVRRLHRRPGAGRPEVAGLRPPPARARPHPHRRRHPRGRDAAAQRRGATCAPDVPLLGAGSSRTPPRSTQPRAAWSPPRRPAATAHLATPSPSVDVLASSSARCRRAPDQSRLPLAARHVAVDRTQPPNMLFSATPDSIRGSGSAASLVVSHVGRYRRSRQSELDAAVSWPSGAS